MTPTRRPLRIALIAVAAVVVIVVGAGAVLVATVDPNAYKPDIVEAAKRATGRDLALNGTITLKPSLWPTLQVLDVTFSNPAGFSRPQMMSLQGIELQLALLPLLSGKIELDRVMLIRPDILLETDANGRSNWQMTPAATAPVSPVATPQTTAKSGKVPTSVAIESIRIQDGTLAYRDGKTNTVTTLGLPGLDATAASPDAPLHIEADASYNGTAFKLAADTGSLTRLQDQAATSAWPLKLLLTVAGAKLTVDGSMTRPLQGEGYILAINGSVPDASSLPPLLQQYLPPPLHDAGFSAKLADVTGQPLSIDATVQAAGATVSAKGTVADARAMTGASIALNGQIPDLSLLSSLARRPLPAVKPLGFQATLTDAAGGFRNGAALHGLSVTSAVGDLSGDATISLGARNALTAALKSDHFNLDLLQSGIDQTQAGALPTQNPTQPADAKVAPPKHDNRLFSDQPISFDGLRSADADVTLAIASLHAGGADYKAIDTHAILKDGKLDVDPFTGDLPEGHLTGTLSVNAAQAEPAVHLTLHAPGLALKTLLAAAHEPAYATGNLEVSADLHGTGASPHAIAASLDGTLGLAVPAGTIDTRLLGKVTDTLNSLNLVGKGSSSELKCFGMRMDAQHGIGTFKALTLSSSLLTMTGSGTVNLGEETLAMQLRPLARIGGTNVAIPMNVTGPIRNPAVKVNELGAAESNAGSVAGAVIGNATPLGIVGGLLGADKLLGGGTTDVCAPALAAARGQAVPETAPAATAPAKPGAQNPGAFLKNLFR